MQVVIGRIGRAHGIGGEVTVVPRTDDPDARFAVGSVVHTEPTERGPLRITGNRWHSGRLLVRFAGIEDRNAAEALHGIVLVLDAANLPGLADDEFYDHQLVGLRAELGSGELIGTVAEVVHGAGPDLLAVNRSDGSEVLVPFVRAIVPVVDVADGRLEIDPPEGLLDL
ncbi:MAG TPA: ribosome maturation factor RimM [Mycobacteriales bacterium]|nr:ribosome maturation factor RimM [Mycobacteriales bacterium]